MTDGPGRASGRALARELVAPEVGRATLAVGVGAISQLSALGLLATSAWLLTTASLRPPILTLSVAIAAVRLFALLRGTSRYVERLKSHDVALRVLARLRVWVYERLEPLVPGGLGRGRVGDLLQRIVTDVEGVQDLAIRAALPLLTGGVTAVVATVVAAVLCPSAGLVLGLGLVAGGVVLPLTFQALGRRRGAELSSERGQLSAEIVTTLEGATDLLAFSAAPRALDRLDRLDVKLAEVARRGAWLAGSARGLASALGGVTVLGVVTAALLAPPDRRLSGVVVAVLAFLAMSAVEAIAGLPEAFSRLHEGIGAADRVLKLGSARPVVGEPPPGRAGVVERAPRSVARDVAPEIVAVELDAGYPESLRPALFRLSLELPAGHRLAIVGGSGSGKSTLALVLMRFVGLTHGRLSYDGVDASELSGDDIRSTIAYAPEEPHLFSTSLAGNLRLAKPDASDAELISALERLGLSSMLSACEAGLATPIGQHGRALSGGERQRIGLARALLSDRPVLLLDEPTAHLDRDTEVTVRNRLLEASEGKTLVYITHRLVGLEAFDEVAVLDGGELVARGRPDVLAEREGPYATLLADQDGIGALESASSGPVLA